MIVVTGANGFIGTNLVAALNRAGRCDLVAVDRFEPLRYPEAGVVSLRVDRDRFVRWLAEAGSRVEAVYHLGACSDTAATDRRMVMASNFDLTRSIWDFCARHGRPLVYASSAATYGDGSAGFDDRVDPARYAPLSLYAESKQRFDLWALERAAAGWAPPRWAGVKYFNVYGPWEDHKGRMASMGHHWINQVRACGSARIFRSHREGIGHGDQRRDFVHVDDAVAATMHLMNGPAVAGGLYNVGTGVARSFADLARAVFAALGRRPDLRFVDMPAELRPRYQYYTRAAVSKLRGCGFGRAFASIEQGVRRTVEHRLSAEGARVERSDRAAGTRARRTAAAVDGRPARRGDRRRDPGHLPDGFGRAPLARGAGAGGRRRARARRAGRRRERRQVPRGAGRRGGSVHGGADDARGEQLCAEVRSLGVDTGAVVVDATRPTTVKTRVMAGQQQMLRLDRESTAPVDAGVSARLIARVEEAVRRSEAVILSDYSKGVLTDAVCRAAIRAAGDRPVVVDPKDPPWDRYAGATLIKPNRPEASALTGDTDDAPAAARDICRRLKVNHALITRGDRGMTLASGAADPATQIPPIRCEVFDATGAGDVVAAVLTLALAAGADAPAAAVLANVAGSIGVSKFGPASVTGVEILEAVGGRRRDCDHKLMSVEQAAAMAADLHRRGGTVVFTNGCFDILHLGHVRMLERSAHLGDALIVGVNTDASVGRLKGAGRPLQRQGDRASIIASQACVDAVVLFDGDTPLDLIGTIRPDVLTKGSDYRRKQDIVGWDLVESWGGRVERIDLVRGRSTSRLIERTGRRLENKV